MTPFAEWQWPPLHQRQGCESGQDKKAGCGRGPYETVRFVRFRREKTSAVGLYFTPSNPGRVHVSRPITPDHAIVTP